MQHLNNTGIISFTAMLLKKWKAIRKAKYIDPEVERFRYIENLDENQVHIELIMMSKDDKKALLDVLLNKSEHTQNNMLLVKMIQIMLIEGNAV